MIKPFSILILLSAALLSSCSETVSEEDEISNLYENYIASVYQKRIPDMVACVNSETVNYYDEIVRKAKHSDSIEISSAKLVDRILALYIRQTTPSSELKNYTGQELMYFALSKGVNTKTPLPKLELKEVKIKDSKAEAGFLMDGQDYGNIMFFVKENEEWKMDLSAAYGNEANNSFKMQAVQNGMTENEFVKQMVFVLSGYPLEDQLWHKVLD